LKGGGKKKKIRKGRKPAETKREEPLLRTCKRRREKEKWETSNAHHGVKEKRDFFLHIQSPEGGINRTKWGGGEEKKEKGSNSLNLNRGEKRRKEKEKKMEHSFMINSLWENDGGDRKNRKGRR